MDYLHYKIANKSSDLIRCSPCRREAVLHKKEEVEPSSSKSIRSATSFLSYFPFERFELVVSSLTLLYSYGWDLLQKVDWNNFLPSNPYQEYDKNRQNLLKWSGLWNHFPHDSSIRPLSSPAVLPTSLL